MLISVRHTTRYVYAEPVSYTVQSLRLTPAPFAGQRVLDWSVRVPGCGVPLEFRDGFGNTVHLVTQRGKHNELVIEAGGTVDTTDTHGVVNGLGTMAPPRVFLKETPQTRPDAAIRDLAASLPNKDKDPITRLHALAGAVRDRVDYVKGSTDAHTEAAEALADGKGVCQDHAHIFIAAARTLGIPGRYVTGYLLLDEGEQETGEEAADATEADISAAAGTADAHHAWAEAWVESLGWVAFDVANRICTTDHYVRLACGLDATSAAPIVGSRRGGGGEKLEVSVAVHQQQQSAQQ
jgi:transglutaminase-like putative cysteine protease